MRENILFTTALYVLLINCFAVKVSYGQVATRPSGGSQASYNVFFNYTPETNPVITDISRSKTNSSNIIFLPYLIQSDSANAMATNPGEGMSYITGNNDTLNFSDSLGVFASDADSIDNKEAYTNSIAVPEPATGKEVKTNDNSVSIPAELAETKIDRLINKYAEMISLEPEDVKNYPLYKFINDWYGVKYKWGGTEHTGIDCSGFSQKLYDKIYGTSIQRTARQQHKSSEKIKDYGEATEGDLVFFRIHHIRISHVGVYLANGYFVHASRSHGVVISSLDDHYWRSRYAGCGKIVKPERAPMESDFTE